MKLNSLGGSVVFTRCRQCAPLPSTPQSASALYRFCPLLSCFEYINPGMSWADPFRPQYCPSRVCDLDPVQMIGLIIMHSLKLQFTTTFLTCNITYIAA